MTLNLKTLTLRQEIILVLSLKAILLFALWVEYFSGVHDVAPDVQHASTHALEPHSTKEPNHDANQRAR